MLIARTVAYWNSRYRL